MNDQLPIYINVRDRLTHLRELVAWLEYAGHERIILLDNASTYEPLLDYLDASPHDVRRFTTNYGSRALWLCGADLSEWFVYTDPDVVPIDECPTDAVAHLKELSQRFGNMRAGLGLYLDDVPETMDFYEWEKTLVAPKLEVLPEVYRSLIDTTFCVYQPNAVHQLPALRLGHPYQCRHMPWYSHENPSQEDRYYLRKAIPGPLGSAWAQKPLS